MLKVVQTENGVNPFDELDCPVCEGTDFVSLDYASVYCDHCNTRFHIRATAGDPGYVADAFTEDTWKDDAKRPELLDKKLYRIMKDGEKNREWLVYGGTIGNLPVPVSHFLQVARKDHTDLSGKLDALDVQALRDIILNEIKCSSCTTRDERLDSMKNKFKAGCFSFSPEEMKELRDILDGEMDPNVRESESYRNDIQRLAEKIAA